MDKLILADGTQIELQEGSALGDIRVVFPTKEALIETWNAFTPENLQSVTVTDANDEVIGEYTNLVLVSSKSTPQEDGSIYTSFALREKTQLEIDVEELKADMQALNETIGGTE